MNRPPAGLCCPVRAVRVIDGDTIEISFPGSLRVYPVRLLDCWAPETRTRDEAEKIRGRAAQAYAQHILDHTRELHLFLPAPASPLHILRALSLERLTGHLYINETETLADRLIEAGHATKKKPAS